MPYWMLMVAFWLTKNLPLPTKMLFSNPLRSGLPVWNLAVITISPNGVVDPVPARIAWTSGVRVTMPTALTDRKSSPFLMIILAFNRSLWPSLSISTKSSPWSITACSGGVKPGTESIEPPTIWTLNCVAPLAIWPMRATGPRSTTPISAFSSVGNTTSE